MPEQIKKTLEQSFKSLIHLAVVDCDLRTFENFPKLPNLMNVNVSRNSLRGSFEFLVKNRLVQYIDVSYNLIDNVKKFNPLCCLKNIKVYAKFNPFCEQEPERKGRNPLCEELKTMGVVLLDAPLLTQSQLDAQKALTTQ